MEHERPSRREEESQRREGENGKFEHPVGFGREIGGEPEPERECEAEGIGEGGDGSGHRSPAVLRERQGEGGGGEGRREEVVPAVQAGARWAVR